MKNLIFSAAITNRSESLERYMSDCNRYRLMDDTQIAEAISKGDYEAVICANLKIVISIAKCYQGMGLLLDDLISEGNIGLINAAKAFDVTRGIKFTTCALQHVRKAITEAITDKGKAVRYPKYKATDTYGCASIDAPIGGSDEDGNERTMLDSMASGDTADHISEADEAQHTIKVLLGGLTEREQTIICKLFGIGCNEESAYTLAQRYGMTEERIRQIKVAALEKMRQLA